jgi:hypothetical protein
MRKDFTITISKFAVFTDALVGALRHEMPGVWSIDAKA